VSPESRRLGAIYEYRASYNPRVAPLKDNTSLTLRTSTIRQLTFFFRNDHAFSGGVLNDPRRNDPVLEDQMS